MANEAELKELAAQLRQPDGAKGIEVGEMMHQTNIGMTRHSIDRLELQGAEQVLELGHGNGAHLAELLGSFPLLTYTGIDISALMHEAAKRENKRFVGEGRASFHLYDGTRLPFGDNSFDGIFTVNTVYFWKNPPAMLAELYRVLRHGGRLNITYAQRAFMEQLPFTQFAFELYDEAKMEALVRQTEFTIAGSETKNEQVKTKTGELVDRAFTTVTLLK